MIRATLIWLCATLSVVIVLASLAYAQEAREASFAERFDALPHDGSFEYMREALKRLGALALLRRVVAESDQRAEIEYVPPNIAIVDCDTDADCEAKNPGIAEQESECDDPAYRKRDRGVMPTNPVSCEGMSTWQAQAPFKRH